jgi:hypothetical protein
MAENSSTKAASPPADAPIPTTGKADREGLVLLDVIHSALQPWLAQGRWSTRRSVGP